MSMATVAHVKRSDNGEWEKHSLQEHLHATATRAGEFAAAFGNRDWAELLGFWHDIGKFHPAWQKYLRRKSAPNEENKEFNTEVRFTNLLERRLTWRRKTDNMK